MDERDIHEIAKIAAREAIEEYTRAHACRFTEEEAKTLHEINDAKVAEKADAGTMRVIMIIGKDAQDITKTLRRKLLTLIVVVLILSLGFLLGPACVKWITGLAIK